MSMNPARKRSWDRDALRELELFIDNDAGLYRQQVVPIINNLKRKLAKGTYSFPKSVKLWGYLMDNGARKYTKEFGGPGTKWFDLFPTYLRKHLAKRYATGFLRKYRNGEFGANPYSISSAVGGSIHSVSPPQYNPRRRRRS